MKDEHKSYLIAWSTRRSLDPYKDPGRDEFEVFEGKDAHNEALNRYRQLFHNKYLYTINLCEILKSSEAYEGVEFETGQNLTKK